MKKKQNKLTVEEKALLQARHLYNLIKVEHIKCGHGFTIGKNILTLKVNHMAWGYFEQTILDAFKKNKKLRKRNPDLFVSEKVCKKCRGAGELFCKKDSPKYKKAYKEYKDSLFEDEKPKRFGITLRMFCSKCQGTGIVLKKLPKTDCEIKK